MMQARDRLIVAADLSSADEIRRLAAELRDAAGAIKIGLQAFVANGPGLVRDIVAAGHRVFLDLKLHDIPNTVQHAVHEAETLGAAMLTVHAAGGEAMLRAARSETTLVLAVTILTSLSDQELWQVGFHGRAAENAVRLATLAQQAGIRGVVASPLEIEAIREACGAEMTIVTPGIRSAGAAEGDQRRTLTPAGAIRAGADAIVVGRPITGAANRRDAALRIVEEMERAG
ncbi:MAG TPA: orotidine-5'-phosphate decarboxylase [Thermoanaerobaculia bacterium]|nr:orotidine-5'-phosphate decarboxylase [Thermoanaerobaculia bacterium]